MGSWKPPGGNTSAPSSERATRSIRLAEGIPVDKMTWRQITQAAESVGVAERALAAALEA
jgi:LDH2 family malate/lactate/ureidoglycolate dehydrogenase